MKFKAGYALLVSSLLVGCGGDAEPVDDVAPAPVEEQPEEALEATKPGMVMLRVKKASLHRDILPIFEEQAGVRIRWSGSEREVTIRMIQPMEWREALELVCQFTGTHVATDYRGRLILKNGYGGSLSSDDALIKEERRRQSHGRGKSSGTPTRSTSSSRPTISGGSRRETVENTRGAGDATNRGVKYNEGRKPGSIFDSIGGVTHH